MLARELPKKRRPTEVSALIIGSAGAIGWHNSSLKVHLKFHCWVPSAPANGPRAQSVVACVSKRFSQRESTYEYGKSDYPPQGQGLQCMADELQWTRAEPRNLPASRTERCSATPMTRMTWSSSRMSPTWQRPAAWLGSAEMKTAMEKSGVVGSPSIRFAVAA